MFIRLRTLGWRTWTAFFALKAFILAVVYLAY